MVAQPLPAPSPASAPPLRPRAAARALAIELHGLLADTCEHLVIAGSIRRHVAEVKDVELVAVPRPPRATFGQLRSDKDQLLVRCDELLAAGVLAKRFPTHYGPKSKRLIFKGIAVDLFSAEAGNFGVHLLIRTGPGQFSNRIVTPRDRRTHDGLPGLLPRGFEIKDGFWLHRDKERVETPYEPDVFEALELPYLEPHNRTPNVRLTVSEEGGRAYRDWLLPEQR